MSDDAIKTQKQAAEFVRMTTRTIRRWEEDEEIKTTRKTCGYYDQEELLAARRRSKSRKALRDSMVKIKAKIKTAQERLASTTETFNELKNQLDQLADEIG